MFGEGVLANSTLKNTSSWTVDGENENNGRPLKPFMRIVLDEVVDDPDPIIPGSQGTFVDYDGAGDLLVDWDPITTSTTSTTSDGSNVGRSLHLIPKVDGFVVEPL